MSHPQIVLEEVEKLMMWRSFRCCLASFPKWASANDHVRLFRLPRPSRLLAFAKPQREHDDFPLPPEKLFTSFLPET
jgi:hypothetical protein